MNEPDVCSTSSVWITSQESHLLTPLGLRTLSPQSPAYIGRYEGNPSIRDADAPHVPRGCPFQAWSLGELIRIRRLLIGVVPPAR